MVHISLSQTLQFTAADSVFQWESREGRLFPVTSLSVGYSQADCRYGRVSDVAVELQKPCVFLPGCFHYWHCKQEERNGGTSKHGRNSQNFTDFNQFCNSCTIFKKQLIQCINTGAGASPNQNKPNGTRPCFPPGSM